jgi:TatA/E family protein of Tat protein translocase
MFGIGFQELLIIFIIALIFIGPKKLPELAKGLGQGIKEFQKAAKGLTDQLQEDSSSQEQVIEPPRLTDAEVQSAEKDSAATEQKPSEEKPS